MAKTLLVSANVNTAVSQNSALTNYYAWPTCSAIHAAGTSETGNTGGQVKFYQAGTLSNLRIYVTSYTVNGDTTVRSRKNGANGGQSFTITNGSGSGYYYDDTGTDTVAAGDLMAVQIVTAGSSGAIGFTTIAAVFAATTDTVVVWGGNASNTLSRNTTYYRPIAGDITANATEDNCKIKIKNAGTVKNLRIKVNSYNIGVTNGTDYKLRINGASSTNIAINFTGTGIYEDTGSDTVAAGDDLNFIVVTDVGSGGQVCQVAQHYIDFVTTNSGYALLTQLAGGTSNSITVYAPIAGSYKTTSTEANVQIYLKHAGSATSLRVKATAGASDTHLILRKEGSNTALDVNVTGSGSFEDTDAGISIAATDRLSYSRTGGASNFNAISLWMTNTDPTATGKITAVDADLTTTEVLSKITAVDSDVSSTEVLGKITALDSDVTTVERSGKITAVDSDISSSEMAAQITATDSDLSTSEVSAKVTAVDSDVSTSEVAGKITAVDSDLTTTEIVLGTGKIVAVDADVSTTEVQATVTAVDADLTAVDRGAVVTAVDADLTSSEIGAAISAVDSDLDYSTTIAGQIVAVDSDLSTTEISAQLSAADADLLSSEVSASLVAVDADLDVVERAAKIVAAHADLDYTVTGGFLEAVLVAVDADMETVAVDRSGMQNGRPWQKTVREGIIPSRHPELLERIDPSLVEPGSTRGKRKSASEDPPAGSSGSTGHRGGRPGRGGV